MEGHFLVVGGFVFKTAAFGRVMHTLTLSFSSAMGPWVDPRKGAEGPLPSQKPVRDAFAPSPQARSLPHRPSQLGRRGSRL